LPPASRLGTRPPLSRTTTPRATPAEIEQLVATRLFAMEHGADFYTMLGASNDAPPEAIRAAFLRLSAVLHPSRLAEAGYADDDGRAARLFEHLETACTTVSDPTRRAAYDAALERGGDTALNAARVRTYEEVAGRSPAEDAFHKGNQALRADQPAKAIAFFMQAEELDTTNHDYTVMRAWSQFCAALNKDMVAAEVRKTLTKATHHADAPELAWLYLGRVERMLGRDREALAHFHRVLELVPNHPDARSELRVLETRLASARKR
jgi:tetratricopeptide (TPR) repeat protein